MKKRILTLLCLMVMVLAGCGSGYADASVDVPGNWADYTIGELKFKFVAGWKSGNWDPTMTDMDVQMPTLGQNNNLAIFGRLVAPASDKGTVNYVDFGYWDTGRAFEIEEMENMMEAMDDLGMPMRKLALYSDDVQASRIRTYNDDITAMTVAYRLEFENASAIMQVALVPHGTRVYMICYSDFSSDADDSTLEALLTTLSFTN